MPLHFRRKNCEFLSAENEKNVRFAVKISAKIGEKRRRNCLHTLGGVAEKCQAAVLKDQPPRHLPTVQI